MSTVVGWDHMIPGHAIRALWGTGLWDLSTESDSKKDQAAGGPKRDWYVRYQNARLGRDNKISNEDLKKYTGKSKTELEKWAETTPGVGKNQVGKNQVSIAAGSSPGIGKGTRGPSWAVGNEQAERLLQRKEGRGSA
ncbi:hypothetical protein DL769_002245 [Monosporascus sp. CRB-8-3]|nr:hypothetical protein DL769_002245 [Monosporascus sp. CRB-8-3]